MKQYDFSTETISTLEKEFDRGNRIISAIMYGAVRLLYTLGKLLSILTLTILVFPVALFLASVWVDLLIDALDTIAYVLERYFV